MQYPASELVLNSKGEVYHLGLSPEQIAHKIILVGDQDRVHLVSSLFDSVEHTSQHREFVCHTGMYKGKRISAVSTGIGTDNVDITVNELDALVNIDLINRKDTAAHTHLEFIRIGTCGILQPDIPIHSYILSSHAYGLDNVAHFYNIDFSAKEDALRQEITNHIQFPEDIRPYMIEASANLVAKLDSEKTYQGITVTSSGFYGPQGRQLRLKNTIDGLNDKLTQFRGSNGEKVTNFEMESSALFSLSKGMGHSATTICLGIANRPNMEFSKGYHDEMVELIRYVLERF